MLTSSVVGFCCSRTQTLTSTRILPINLMFVSLSICCVCTLYCSLTNAETELAVKIQELIGYDVDLQKVNAAEEPEQNNEVAYRPETVFLMLTCSG